MSYDPALTFILLLSIGRWLSQRQYYNKKAKEAVYQRFSSPSIPEARLMRKVLGDWYFIVPGTDDTFSYMVLAIWKAFIHIG